MIVEGMRGKTVHEKWCGNKQMDETVVYLLINLLVSCPN